MISGIVVNYLSYHDIIPHLQLQRNQLLVPGQRSSHSNRKPLQQAETGAGEKGRKQKRHAPGPPEANRRAPAAKGHQVPHRRHHVLLRLRTDAQAAAHSRSGEVLRRLRHTQGADGPLAVHVPHVPAGRVHAELSRRPGHHQPLQTAAGAEDEKARGTGNADVHDFDTYRRERVVMIGSFVKVSPLSPASIFPTAFTPVRMFVDVGNCLVLFREVLPAVCARKPVYTPKMHFL